MARPAVYALRWSVRGGTWTRGKAALPFPLAVATIGCTVSRLAHGFEHFPFRPLFLHALLLSAFPFSATVTNDFCVFTSKPRPWITSRTVCSCAIALSKH